MWPRIFRALSGKQPGPCAVRNARRVRILNRSQVRERQRALALESLEQRHLLSAVRTLTDFTPTNLPLGDDISSAAVEVGFQFNFFGQTHDRLYVNTNGNATFDAPLAGYSNAALRDVPHEIVAPFWADVDTRNAAANAVTYGPGKLGDRRAFAVNWTNVGSFDQQATQTNSFQLILIERADRTAGDMDIEFNYDRITWDTAGPRPGGPATVTAARAGISNGSKNLGTFYELIGSAQTGAFLNTNSTTGLVNTALGSTELGRFVFQVKSGTPLTENGLAGQTLQIAADVTYYGEGFHPYYRQLAFQPSNANAVDTINAETLIPGGSSGLDLTGSGVAIGVVEANEPHVSEDTNGNGTLDAGEDLNGNGTIDVVTGGALVRVTHQDLTGHATVSGTDPGYYSNHATQVAGTIAGAGTAPDTRGFAPSATITSFPISTDFGLTDAQVAGLQVTNHGYNWDFGWDHQGTTENFNGGPFITSGPNNEDLNGNGVDDRLSLWLADRSTDTEDDRFGAYSEESEAIDRFLADATQPNRLHVISVQSVGNDRDDQFTDDVAAGFAGVNRYVTYFSAGFGGGPPGWYAVPNTGASAAPASDGNAGAGTDSLPSAGTTAKNALVIGAVRDIVSESGDSGPLPAFTAWGPTDDGRIKPDLMANGVDVRSPAAAANDAYGTADGTSLAAASATGAIALLTEYYNQLGIEGGNPTSATLKALLIHTATDLFQTGPDYRSGWGLINTLQASRLLTRLDSPPAAGVYGLELNAVSAAIPAGVSVPVTLLADRELTATLVWTDPAGNGRQIEFNIGPGSGTVNPDPALDLDPATAALVNDLNLTIRAPDGTVYRPWVLDPANPTAAATTGTNSVDNVEQVRLITTQNGVYTITVQGTLGLGPSQNFSLLYTSSAQALDDMEPNDSVATATRLGSRDNLLLSDLTIHSAQDTDVFRITAHQTGKLVVNALYDATAGDLNVRVVDRFGNVVADSPEATPSHLVFPAVGQQTYYVEVQGVSGATNVYDLEIENFAAPRADLIDLPARDLDDNSILNDTGSSQQDNVTNRLDADLLITADLSEFAAEGIPILTAANAALSQMGAAVEVFVNGSSAGFADPVTGSGNTLFRFTFPAGQLPVQTIRDAGGWLHYVQGAVTVIDGQRDSAGNVAPARGRTPLSSPLLLTIDTEAPAVTIGGIVSASAGSTSGLANSLADRITSQTLPKFHGESEDGALVRLWTDGQPMSPAVIDASDTLQGSTVAVSGSGAAAGSRRWEISARIGLNDATLTNVRDGVRQVGVIAEDLAGNASVPVFLDIFVDTQGPQLADVHLVDDPATPVDESAASLLTGKGLAGPTPAIRSVMLVVRDLPLRTGEFLYGALSHRTANGADVGPTEFRVVGESVGTIPIERVIIGVPAAVAGVTDATQFSGQPASFPRAPELRAQDDFYNGWLLRFTSGALVGQQGVVTDYVGATRTLVFAAGTFAAAPAISDAFHLTDPGDGATTLAETTVELQFAQEVPDDRYTIIVTPAVIDPAGNSLASTSGDLSATGIRLGQFTLDHQGEIGVWARGSAYLDTNGNFRFDPDVSDPSRRDIVQTFGMQTDFVFSGNFPHGATADGYDKLAAYGRTVDGFRWVLDTTNDGSPDLVVPAPVRVVGQPVAGDFAPSLPGDELGLFTGSEWLLHQTSASALVEPVRIPSQFKGIPVVGDWDGDGAEDLGTWDPSSNTFFLSLSSDAGGAGGVAHSIAAGQAVATTSFRLDAGYPFAGLGDRPVTTDMDGDGIDDLGLWVPDRGGVTPTDTAEWYFLVSHGAAITTRLTTDVLNPSGRVIRFNPSPFGHDIFAQFGNRLALPLVGNFDPPLSAPGAATAGGSSTTGSSDIPLPSAPPTQSTPTQPPTTPTTQPTTPPVVQPALPASQGNAAPVVRPVAAPLTARGNAPPLVVELSRLFADPDGDRLRYSVVSQTNPALTAPDIRGNCLSLALARNVTGTDQITLRATDTHGAFAEQNLTLQVNPVATTGRTAGGDLFAAQSAGTNGTADVEAEVKPGMGLRTATGIVVDTNGDHQISMPSGQGDTRYPAFGLRSDYVLAGRFVADAKGKATSFDSLIAYGRVTDGYRWLVDFNGDGSADRVFAETANFIGSGVPVVGDFDADPKNGDEVGLFTGSRWYLDRDHDFQLSDEQPLLSTMTGLPVSGDFDGDGWEDLATWNSTTSRLQLSLSSSARGGALENAQRGKVEPTHTISFSVGTLPRALLERLVAADLDQDGIDDLGIWTAGSTPAATDTWSFAVSRGWSLGTRLADMAAKRASFVVYVTPSGGEPLLGNFRN